MNDRQIKVLLIEDNPGDVRLIREMLKDFKDITVEIDCVDRLDTGLKRLSKGSFDAVLLDLGLPDSQGLDTFIKVHSENPDVAIVVMTGLEDEELAVKTVQKGAQDYLVKGQVDSKLLSRALRYAVERKRAEKQIKASLREKEVLLQEVHHRVKNNMQIISSLLRLQSRKIKGKRALQAFESSYNRVKSMVLIHERLYQSRDFARVDFAEYVHGLTNHLFSLFHIGPETVKLDINIKDISLDLNTAIPCGLIVNELVSNSLKHAFPDDRKGKVKIVMKSLNTNEIELTASDNGIGIPEDLDFRETESLGLHLVSILAEDQLRGKIKLDKTKGTRFEIKFKAKQ
jgi:two-component sensor histidine kinase